jgi:hypothetical protein
MHARGPAGIHSKLAGQRCARFAGSCPASADLAGHVESRVRRGVGGGVGGGGEKAWSPLNHSRKHARKVHASR